MLVILNNRIASGRSQTELDSLEATPRNPGGRGSVFTMPSARRVGESSIIVTKDRLIFRLDSDRPLPMQPLSDGDARSTKESARSSNPIYVSNVLAILAHRMGANDLYRDMLSVRKGISLILLL